MRMSTDALQATQKHSVERNELWDYLRGMAMISVLLHHSGVPIGEYILAFHMPLFFVLSGYIDYESGKQKEFWVYLKKKILRLIVPYFLFEAVNLLLWQAELMLMGGWQDVTEALKSIFLVLNTDGYMGLYGRLWFLPCMFVADIIFYFVKRYFSRSKSALCVAAAVLLLLSWITSELLPFRLPFTMDSALFAAVFLIAGFVLGRKIAWIISYNHGVWELILFVSMAFITWMGVDVGRASCLMFVNQYGNYFSTVITAACGSTAFLILSKWSYACFQKFSIGKNLVLWYGRNSLASFPIHLLIKIYAVRYIRAWPVLFLVMLVLNIPIVNIITRYFPFMLGKLPNFALHTCKTR